ncbi:MAG: CDP-alcohol phosphatidyltransferase family protein [Candidatus Komeilibacteria bacterium]
MLLDEIKFYVRLRDGKDRIFKPLVNITPNWLTPNIITFIRFLLIIPLVYLWLKATDPYFIWESLHWWIVGIIIFLGPFTDYWDGAVARFKDKISMFGIYFDPITDKLFSIPVFLLFTWQWPFLTSLYFLINLRIFLILLTFVKAAFHNKYRLSKLLQYFYVGISFIGYGIWAIKFVYNFL